MNILTVFACFLLITVMLANREPHSRYLMPIMPALWLLSAHAITSLSRNRPALNFLGFALVVASPLAGVLRLNYELTQPDTRIVAKEWIEANIPTGAKILMDGSRYRFVQSPPVAPDDSTIARRLAGVTREDGLLSRGISEQMQSLYAEAMRSRSGPRYELHSTSWGLALEDPDWYLQQSFDYVVTSSMISNEINRELFPASANFYDQLKVDSRFQLVYAVKPVPWQRRGPTITIYRIAALDIIAHPDSGDSGAPRRVSESGRISGYAESRIMRGLD